MKMFHQPTLLILACFFVVSACQKEDNNNQNQNRKSSLDISKIEQVLNMKGLVKEGELKVTVAQNDLHIVVDSFKIIPPMGLGSWAAFSSAEEDAMVMGDIIVTETELGSVQKEVIKQGLEVTAIHNHFVRDTPHVMYMHIGGMGSEEKLASGVKAVFEKVKELRGGNPADGAKDSVINTLDKKLLDDILGTTGEMSRGVYKHTIGRPDIDLKDHKNEVSTFLGFNTWAAWQGTPEKAAVAGDFAMLEDEVAPVIKALIENEIEVVAVHNHMVHEEPKIFFLHYWGIGSAEKLARGLRAALDQTRKSDKKLTASSSAAISDSTISMCSSSSK
jgi:hypothetical protein